MITTTYVRSRGGPNGYGHISDPVGHLRTSVRKHPLFGSSGPAPKSFFVGQPTIVDQNDSSECTGASTGGACKLYFASINDPIPDLSLPGIYTFGRAIDRLDPNIPLTDVGAMPNQVMRGITEWGLPLFGSHSADINVYGSPPDTSKNQ